MMISFKQFFTSAAKTLVLTHIGFFAHILGTFLVFATITTYLRNLTLEYATSDLIHVAIYTHILTLAVKTLSRFYDVWYKWPLRIDYDIQVFTTLATTIQKMIIRVSCNDVDTLRQKNVEQYADKLRWATISLFECGIDIATDLCSSGMDIVFAMYLFPTQVVVFVLGMILAMYVYPLKRPSIDNHYDAWMAYDAEKDRMMDRVIHQQHNTHVAEIERCSRGIYTVRMGIIDITRTHTSIMDTVQDVLVAVGMALMWYSGEEITGAAFVIYLRYMDCIGGTIVNLNKLYADYIKAGTEYDRFVQMFDGMEDAPVIEYRERPIASGIDIQSLSFSYAREEGKANFGIVLEQPLMLKPGDLVRLEGGISNGKSTFINVITGIIPYTKCSTRVLIDGEHERFGFSALIRSRLVYEQTPSIHWVGESAFTVITGKRDYDERLADDVMEVLAMAQSDEFFCVDADSGKKRFIGKANINPSPGLQEGILIARLFYRMKRIGRPSMVVCDEIGRAMDPARVGTVMDTLVRWCKRMGTVLVVSAHIPVVGDRADFDHKLHFENGRITHQV